MVGWDISVSAATFSPQEAEALRQVGTPLATFCVEYQRILQQFSIETTHLPGFDLPDPIAMAIALDPEVKGMTKHLFVTVETQSELCRGQTVVDHLGVTGQPPNAEVVLSASRDRFLQLLYSTVGGQRS
jgi:purine nucleosidase